MLSILKITFIPLSRNYVANYYYMTINRDYTFHLILDPAEDVMLLTSCLFE